MSRNMSNQYDQVPVTPIEIDIGKKKSGEDATFHQLEIEQPDNGIFLNNNLFENMINSSGITTLQIEALLFTGLIYLLEGLQVSLSGLIFLPIMSQYNLSSYAGCIVSSSLVFFMAIGSISTGYLTNKWQRRPILVMGLSVIFMGNLIAYINSVVILLLTRSIIGFSLGAIMPITMNNLVEVMPAKFRSFWIIAISVFFSVGAILSCSFLFMTYPNIDNFFVILSIPSFVVFLLYAVFYRENARYLILNGEHEKGFDIIEKFMNDGKKLDETERVQIIKGVDFGMNKEVKLTGKVYFMFKRYGKVTIILTCIWVLHSVMVNGGVFNLFIGLSNSAGFLYENEDDPEEKKIGDYKDTFHMFIIFYAIFAVSVILAGLITEIKCLGRKFTIFVGFLISSLVSLFILLEGFGSGLFFALGAFFINVSFNAINSYSVEIYPTRVRDFAVGYLQFLSRISGFLSNLTALFIFEALSDWVFYLNVVIGVSGLVFTLMLPFDTYNRELDKAIDNGKKVKERPNEEIII